ncbi:unnamed protein product [Lepeophtheirus salmonis]|uniref:(salmon louse) hypothetical protein n=1 Tax=Lepeophtheirus salmonis TaxID=72036 RepID=A0A7R8HDY3_LEPSM|nr:unnamed protein product [Lepeophtheirus salmonis]CAF3035434.1 unnamed protein product [Lepeophtheirus salmonis]
MVIGDEELRRRLKEQNYPIPPITDTTRHVLLKKLQQLENEESCEGAEDSAEDEEGGGGGSLSRNEPQPFKKKSSTLRRRVIHTNGGSIPPVAGARLQIIQNTRQRISLQEEIPSLTLGNGRR